MRISVIGSGGWGIAMSVLLSQNGHDVTLWSFLEEEAKVLSEERENKKLLPGVILPPEIKVTTDISCASGADIIVLATPSFAVAQTAEKLVPFVSDGQCIVSLSKGLDRENGYSIFSDTLRRILGNGVRIAVLTGPSHAEEVGKGVPTAVVAASEDIEVCGMIQDEFMCDRFRVYTTTDIIGAQLGGALKNVIALAAGMCDGMGFGDNTKAALMTRGLTEMARLGVSMGGRRETFVGLSGLGDLIVTCTSMHSRNRRAGILIGKGASADEAMKEVGAVVEGYYAVEAGHMMAARTGTSMPICEALYSVLYENADISECFNALMTRSKRYESEDYLEY